ncbi:hypothetical protein PV11_03984 [Exophiala sideris]|uniref:FHA domain-containing protein n=1 Tax=Exophiala sideris TaxID=1016849 RepID=A0A0D1Z4N1_9EURO|nr:hypothetical protein PV11_03984 [Exophiala sideris]
MVSLALEPQVTVTLRNLDKIDPIPERHIVLKSPSWSVKIGRGTQSGDEQLRPSANNAWFDSRVMSRSHAMIYADPENKTVYIQDTGSMHGTHFSGRTLRMNAPEPLFPHDVVTLGANVMRGSNYFTALNLMVAWTWSDTLTPPVDAASGPSRSICHNTFSADYSEDDFEQDPESDADAYDEEEYGMDGHAQTKAHQEHHFDQERYFAETHVEEVEEREYVQLDDDDEEVEDDEVDVEVDVVQDSLREPSIEVVYPPRAFTVPDSDDSDAPSYISSREESAAESPTSSQIEIDEGYERKQHELAHEFASDGNGAETIATTKGPADAPAGAARINSDAEQLGGDVQPQAEAHAVRAPSPSDAAMVKSTSEHLMAAPPFVQNTQDESDIARADAAVEFERSESAWAGHNSVLYENLSSVYSVCGSSLTTATPPWPPSYYDTPYLSNEHPWSEAGPYVTLPPLLPSAQAVDPASIHDTAESSARPLKRKADFITSESSSWDGPWSPELSSKHVEPTHAKQNADCEAETQDVRGPLLEADVPVQSTEVEVPPRKKAKQSKQRSSERRGNTGGGIFKIAAATIAGMAIGTVGTIIGLASLPPIA